MLISNNLRLREKYLETKIVCIDRNPADLLRVQSILDSHFELVLISDPTFALREMLASPPRALLFGTDIGGIGAVKLVRHLSEANPSLLNRSLVMTTKEQQSEAQLLFDEGAAGLLLKPLNPDSLFTAVRAVLARAKADKLNVQASNQLHFSPGVV